MDSTPTRYEASNDVPSLPYPNDTSPSSCTPSRYPSGQRKPAAAACSLTDASPNTSSTDFTSLSPSTHYESRPATTSNLESSSIRNGADELLGLFSEEQDRLKTEYESTLKELQNALQVGCVEREALKENLMAMDTLCSDLRMQRDYADRRVVELESQKAEFEETIAKQTTELADNAATRMNMEFVSDQLRNALRQSYFEQEMLGRNLEERDNLQAQLRSAFAEAEKNLLVEKDRLYLALERAEGDAIFQTSDAECRVTEVQAQKEELWLIIQNQRADLAREATLRRDLELDMSKVQMDFKHEREMFMETLRSRDEQEAQLRLALVMAAQDVRTQVEARQYVADTKAARQLATAKNVIMHMAEVNGRMLKQAKDTAQMKSEAMQKHIIQLQLLSGEQSQQAGELTIQLQEAHKRLADRDVKFTSIENNCLRKLADLEAVCTNLCAQLKEAHLKGEKMERSMRASCMLPPGHGY